MAFSEVVEACEHTAFAVSTTSQLYRFRDNPQLIHKFYGSERELQMSRLAGDCAVTIHGRSVSNLSDGGIQMEGLVMNSEESLSSHCGNLDKSKFNSIMQQMITCVERLHSQYRIVHGDIKPDSIRICADGEIRLCDFAEARPINEDPEIWTGDVTVNYISPRRSHYYPDELPSPPTVNDDLYALGLSIWELYTGMAPFAGVYHDDIIEELKQGRTVDVDLVGEDNIKETICHYLELGDAQDQNTSSRPSTPQC